MVKKIRSVPIDSTDTGYEERDEMMKEERQEGPGWFPLLLIPLLILGGALLLPNLANNTTQETPTNPNTGEPQTGVGGGPDESFTPTISLSPTVLTPSPSPTNTATTSPTLSPIELVD